MDYSITGLAFWRFTGES